MWIEPVTAGAGMLQEMQALAADAAAIQPAASTDEPQVSGAAPADFGSYLSTAINSVNQQQLDASSNQRAIETGESTDMVGTMVSTQKASLSFSALVQTRNKVMSGLDDVMNMGL